MKSLTRIVLVALGCLALGATVTAAHAGAKGQTYEVKVIPDITYCKGDPADAECHQLDLYLPEGKKDFPVLFFVHGGGWTKGSRKKFENLGKTFAKHGVGVVATGYRLSPKVQHPAHIEDVAEAFAWTVANIDKYGGRKDRIFISGHSAGGHLAALLGTNKNYLQKHKLGLNNIRGVIPISGVFLVGGEKKTDIWGKDPEGWNQGSPLKNVTKNSPPFLILYAEKDGKSFHEQGKDLAAELKKAGVEATAREMTGRDHGTVVYQIHQDGDATFGAVMDFIRKHQ